SGTARLSPPTRVIPLTRATGACRGEIRGAATDCRHLIAFYDLGLGRGSPVDGGPGLVVGVPRCSVIECGDGRVHVVSPIWRTVGAAIIAASRRCTEPPARAAGCFAAARAARWPAHGPRQSP